MSDLSLPKLSPATNRRKSIGWVVAVAVIVGLTTVWGADRRPVDDSRPIVWRTPTRERTETNPSLRIASYNIHGGKGTDGRLDLSRIAADLQDVDLAGLYEVHATPGSRFPDQAAELGEMLGLRSAFLGTERRWWHDHFGNAVLTALPVDHILRIPLVGTRGKAFRQAVLLDVPLAGEKVHILMAHVDRAQDRRPQLETVIGLFRALAAPAILMGDLNSGPDDPALQELLREPGVDSVIHSQLGEQAPRDNIDWLITRGLDCEHAEYQTSGASDHPILRAELKIKHAAVERQ